MNVKIFANISEPFRFVGDSYISKYVAAKFLLRIKNIKIASPVINSDETIVNSVVNPSSFVVLPDFTSAFDFITKFLISKSFRTKFNSTVEKEINSCDKVWVRAPSIDSVFIAKIALKNRKPVIMHVAGDLNGVWKNKKYSKLKTIFAFIFAKIILFYISRLAKNQNVYILSTGNDLNKRYSNAINGSELFFDTCLDIPNMEKSGNLVINKNVVKLLYVGRLESDKGVLSLCDMIMKLNSQYIDKKFELTIIGFGTAANELDEQIKKYNLIGSVTHIGFVKNDELSKYYLNHDVFVFPSTAPEGFPRVIQEAWLHGLPVVTSDTGGITGVAIDRVNSIIFKAGDIEDMILKISSLIDDDELFESLHKNILESRNMYTSTYQHNIAIKRINEAEFRG
ncbi:Glycosyltransferase [Moritella sp. JT01]|uniref:glycosyltransferase n=1 Tax=Moritella sp. JT01 TaxID=756698 RepID=UPI000799E06A|nr:glycosyltransferase [Moritella sp. JT01]KXO13734.1 Glycosyltransferase [Moritella sp. JT01]